MIFPVHEGLGKIKFEVACVKHGLFLTHVWGIEMIFFWLAQSW